MCLYSVAATKTLRLDEFDQAQAAATEAAANHLRDNWVASLKHTIKCGGFGLAARLVPVARSSRPWLASGGGGCMKHP